VFWIWLLVSIAEMVNVGLTACASRRYGEGARRKPRASPAIALVLSIALGALCA
jgi:Na+-driven multidrug efflux pump